MAATQRKSTAQFKAKVVLEVLRGEKSPADACRAYKIHNSVLTRWKREFLERADKAFESSEQTNQEEGRKAFARKDGRAVDNAARNTHFVKAAPKQKRHRSS
jgi:transposase